MIKVKKEKLDLAKDLCTEGDTLEIIDTKSIEGISHNLKKGTKVKVHMLSGQRILVDCPNDTFRNKKLHVKHTNAYKK